MVNNEYSRLVYTKLIFNPIAFFGQKMLYAYDMKKQDRLELEKYYRFLGLDKAEA